MMQELDILKVEEKRQAAQDRRQYAEMKKDEYLYRQHIVTSPEADKMRRMKREGKKQEEIQKYFDEEKIELSLGHKAYLEELFEGKKII